MRSNIFKIDYQTKTLKRARISFDLVNYNFLIKLSENQILNKINNFSSKAEVLVELGSNSCIGNFLRKQYEQKIKTNSSNRKNYGAFFWFDISTVSGPTAVMNGHGGQRTIIKLKEGDILSYHAIRSNFDQEKLESIFNK